MSEDWAFCRDCKLDKLLITIYLFGSSFGEFEAVCCPELFICLDIAFHIFFQDTLYKVITDDSLLDDNGTIITELKE